MFSLIICSKNSSDLAEFKKNVASTIGVPFEVVEVNNSKNQFSIFSAYNKAASKAQYPYLIFVHEDVKFTTINWGENLRHHFENLADVGIIGIAGSKYLPKVPSGWFLDCLSKKYCRINYFQGHRSFEIFEKREIKTGNEIASEVVALDGVFLAVKNEIWETFPFDEKTFNGFHFYDLDFSLQVHSKYKNYVVYDIDLIHRSFGNIDEKWIDESIKFSNKWEKFLPKYICLEDKKDPTKIEWTQFFYWIKLVRRHKTYFRTLVQAFKYAPFRYFNYREILKFNYYLFVAFPFWKNK